ncbi:hypothetical protein TNCV_2162091 [Trichonephila clavipes]|nr:hypothetical protein TNCV_2162091 [Trichonephila clavipes]
MSSSSVPLRTRHVEGADAGRCRRLKRPPVGGEIRRGGVIAQSSVAAATTQHRNTFHYTVLKGTSVVGIIAFVAPYPKKPVTVTLTSVAHLTLIVVN